MPLPWALATGVLGGMALLGKQTSGGVLLALVIMLIATRRRNGRIVLLMGLGALIPLAAVALYFAAHGALDDAIDATITINRYYAQESLSPVAIVRSAFTENDAVTTVFLTMSAFAVIGTFAGTRAPMRPLRMLAIWLALTAMIDFFLVNMAATAYAHYFLTPLPAFLALVLLGLEILLTHPWQKRALRQIAQMSAIYVFVIVVLLPNFLDLALIMAASGGTPFEQARSYAVIDYVKRHTAPGDTVLAWGHAPQINLLSGRRSPSRYFYSHPLTLPEYAGATRLATFVDDLHSSKPALIVDAALIYTEKVPPIDTGTLERFYSMGGWRDTADITLFRQFADTYCTKDRPMLVPGGPVTIYRCTYD